MNDLMFQKEVPTNLDVSISKLRMHLANLGCKMLPQDCAGPQVRQITFAN